MIRRTHFLVFVCGFAFLGPTFAFAASPSAEQAAVAAAERELEIAELTMRRYVRVEYPLRLRRLESEIKLTEAVLATQDRRIDEYERFTERISGSAIGHAMQQARLDRLEYQLRLDGLREERSLLTRYHKDQVRLHELQVESARARLESLRPAP